MTTTTPIVCPTPGKSRYATREAAEQAARRVQIPVGQFLRAYQCPTPCDWWHLTSKEPATPVVCTEADVTALHQLDDEAFTDLVTRDALYRAPRTRALALRDPTLAHRWVHTIRAVQRDLAQQLHQRRGNPEHTHWRADTTALQQALGDRRREAAAIIAEHHPVVVPSPRNGEAAMRAAAGDLAIDRLIRAHRTEFDALLVEEYQRIGCTIPDHLAGVQADQVPP